MLDTNMKTQLKVSLELSFHICVEHVYLLGFKHHHASGLCGYLDAACMMMFKAQEINMLDTNMKTQLKVSLELSFHICVEHVYLLGFK
ncbi:hypothetical protein QJN61_24860, partial [Escherichia coli]|uniref:hypothetical protein n=1 Tax=Escherichia coli TaxID=562 RepID=UPI003007873D